MMKRIWTVWVPMPASDMGYELARCEEVDYAATLVRSLMGMGIDGPKWVKVETHLQLVNETDHG